MKGKYNCSVKNSSLRNFLTDKYLLQLWLDWNYEFGRQYKLIWNQFNEECFWIEFRKTIHLEFMRTCKLETLILRINKQFLEWESSKKIGIFDLNTVPLPTPVGSVDFG